MSEISRLRRIEALAKRWARMHADHYAPTTIAQRDERPHVPRSVYLAAESALLAAIRESGE